MINDLLVRAIGWPATILQGDPLVFDRWLFVRRFLRRGDLRTLDAGAGNGGFVMYATRHGNDALGISFDQSELSVAERRAALLGLERARFMVGDLRDFEDLRPDLGEFDQIVCLEVVEHLLDDARLLRNLASVLRPDGRLILTTPSAAHRRLVRERLSASEDGGHVRWATPTKRSSPCLSRRGLQSSISATSVA